MPTKPPAARIRLLAALILVASALPVGGCRICVDCEDGAYPAYGGSWQRTNRFEGRVGSVFDPGGAKQSNLVDRDMPPDPVELERRFQDSQENLFSPESYEPRSDSDESSEESPMDKLRDRTLDDIEEEKEQELRGRSLDDIDVYRGPHPSSPVTAALKRILPF